MRIIHGGGYSETDRRKFVILIHRNIYTAMIILLTAMEELDIPFQTEEALGAVPVLTNIIPDCAQEITHKLKVLIAAVWADEGIQTCFSRRREFQISDSTK